MANICQNDSASINLEDIEEILKKIAEIISKPSKYILDKLKYRSIANEDIGDEINNSENIILEIDADEKIEIYDLVDNAANLLKEDSFFYDEYFDFCEIQDMIKDTLKRDLIKESDLEFILSLVLNFFELVFYKLDLKENGVFNEDNYKSSYNLFLTKFHQSQIYFYENICDETLDDDLFMEYTGIIMR